MKERQREEREQLILAAAEKIFVEKGYYDTSMDEIAAHVGIAKGTVYFHFPGKEELVIAIFVRMMEKLLQETNEALALQEPSRTKLERVLGFVFGDLYFQRIQLFSSLYHSIKFQPLFEEKQSRIHEIWEQLVESITRLIDEGKAQGDVSKALPSDIIVSVFLSFLSPRSFDRLGLGKILPIDDFVHYLGEILFNGISAK